MLVAVPLRVLLVEMSVASVLATEIHPVLRSNR